MRELEALAAAVQDPMAHQLLDAFRGLGLAEIGRPLQQGEVEGPADDRGDGEQAPASVAEPLQAVRDQVADALGKRQRRRVLGQGAAAQGAQRLDDHERVPAAGPPDLLLERARRAGELHERAGQGHRVLAGEGAERQPAQVRPRPSSSSVCRRRVASGRSSSRTVATASRRHRRRRRPTKARSRRLISSAQWRSSKTRTAG